MMMTILNNCYCFLKSEKVLIFVFILKCKLIRMRAVESLLGKKMGQCWPYTKNKLFHSLNQFMETENTCTVVENNLHK